MEITKDYLTILDNIDGLIITDEKGMIEYISERVAGLVHTTREEAVGNYVKDVVYTTTLDKILKTKADNPWEFYFEEGHTIVSTQRAIWEGDRFAGALEFDLFQDPDKIHKFIDKVARMADDLHRYRKDLKQFKPARYSIDDISGDSKVIYDMKDMIIKSAKTNSTVLIEGETGTGKELVAHAIHTLSQRSFAPFIKVNCSAIPGELIESELFGYEEGAFTGARRGGKKGSFELANGGTIFLDEIHQLSMEAQPKILRALQEREITRVGGETTIPVNVRIIAATNVDLEEKVREGEFREDLLYRLNVIEVIVPPLRDRREDIPELVLEFINRNNKFLQKNITRCSEDVIEALQDYDWPGNVRELQNVIERGMNECDYDEELDLHHFAFFMQKKIASMRNDMDSTSVMSLEAVKNAAEKRMIEYALEMNHNNKNKTARQLEISRSVLYRKMEKYGINL